MPPAKHCPLGRSHVLKSAATLLLGIATATQLQFRMLAAMLRRLMLAHSLLHQSLVLRGVISLAALLQAGSPNRGQSATLHTGESKHSRRNASPLGGISHHAIGPSHRTAIVLLGATTRLHPANMLDALTLLVGILHVAIDLRVRVGSRLRLAARLASLAIRAHGTAGAVQLAAALVGSTRDRTQPRLHIGIEHLRGLEGRGINLLERTIRSKTLGLALHGFASLLGSLVHGSS